MKHPASFNNIIKKTALLCPDESISILNFHPGFFSLLIKLLNRKVVVVVDNSLFEGIRKHFSYFYESDDCVFIHSNKKFTDPPGFISSIRRDRDRARGLMVSGLGSINTIVSSVEGLDVPVVGSGSNSTLCFNDGVDYNVCCDFLYNEKYTNVECVTSPGEFSKRGAIIDLFPFSSTYPVRINFFEATPEVYRFNIETQIHSNNKIDAFKLSSIDSETLYSLNTINLADYLCLNYNKSLELKIGAGAKIFYETLEPISHGVYLKLIKNKTINIKSCSILESVGVKDNDKSIFVPDWFINKIDKKVEYTVPIQNHLDMSNIEAGDYLVHRDHGVGVCMGLSISNSNQEFLVLKYSDGGKISIDIDKLDSISFFAHAENSVALDSLSRSGAWTRKLSAAKKSADEAVASLLSLYVKRKNLKGPSFIINSSLKQEFLQAFPYQDTPDQVAVWKEISEDLKSSTPMDRLLCGDVGFGKTELAIRAAFQVVMSGYRVVVLAPTTILVNQLYSSFIDRLESFAVSVDMVSRFKKGLEIESIKNRIINEQNDVLIGTHTVINDDVYTKNLGLLIIDEEHRFGVKQKENIKKKCTGVDVLSMSATPIPRSLNLVMSGIYSISVLQTPPLLRKPILTNVGYYNEELISSVVDFEVGRGGQVYFIHNNVQTIDRMVVKLKILFSNYSIEYIHGQETSNLIESKMSMFVDGNIDVLVCTSIIESGIDVSSANSIIINNSHLFGLSQLYQMRGRVGRGGVQAYAYLLIPKKLSLSDTAYKRIKTIEENISLGSGHNVANADMQIRGSGSLFGYKQSGGSGSIGYELYSKLIQNSINTKIDNKKNVFSSKNILVRFFVERSIPEQYIKSEKYRLSIYNSLSNGLNTAEINLLKNNIINRFGPMPLSFQNLIDEFILKNLLLYTRFESIIRKGCGVIITFFSSGNDNLNHALFEYTSKYWSLSKIVFHMLPTNNKLKICLHLVSDKDSFYILSDFIHKFTTNKLLK